MSELMVKSTSVLNPFWTHFCVPGSVFVFKFLTSFTLENIHGSCWRFNVHEFSVFNLAGPSVTVCIHIYKFILAEALWFFEQGKKMFFSTGSVIIFTFFGGGGPLLDVNRPLPHLNSPSSNL